MQNEKRILIIESYEKHSRLVKDLLEEDIGNVIVDVAKNGEEVKEKINDVFYDLIITDLYVAYFDALKFIRKRKEINRFVVCTHSINWHPQVREYVNIDFIVLKPFDINIFVKVVKKRLEMPIKGEVK